MRRHPRDQRVYVIPGPAESLRRLSLREPAGINWWFPKLGRSSAGLGPVRALPGRRGL
jgi:hypothetical protein